MQLKALEAQLLAAKAKIAEAERQKEEKRKADEARVRARAAELREAGKATAQDALREGQARYDETKVRG